MKTYPLKQIGLEEAIKKQFRVVDCITREFNGFDFLSRGDLGVNQSEGLNKPNYAVKCERVIASIFNQEASILLRGSGTNALRMAFMAVVKKDDKVLVHDAAVYPTTLTTLELLGVEICKVDFNDINKLKEALDHNSYKAALVQLTRQKPDDSYDYKEVIKLIKSYGITTITDDNYAAFKVDEIGAEVGADISTFSCFKVLGPVGVGVCVGKKEIIDKIEKFNYSGGSKVQGFEAMEVLRGFTYAPVSLALSSEVANEVVDKLNNNYLDVVKEAFIVNAQSKVVIVTLKEPIAREIIANAAKLGALPHPVGSESIYEITPLFYKVSGTFLKTDPSYIDYAIRINPMRSGTDTILRILKESIEMIEK